MTVISKLILQDEGIKPVFAKVILRIKDLFEKIIPAGPEVPHLLRNLCQNVI
jgi:hypothetical protein